MLNFKWIQEIDQLSENYTLLKIQWNLKTSLKLVPGVVLYV